MKDSPKALLKDVNEVAKDRLKKILISVLITLMVAIMWYSVIVVLHEPPVNISAIMFTLVAAALLIIVNKPKFLEIKIHS